MFRIGMKVACVDVGEHDGFIWHPEADIPRLDEVYTVTGTFERFGVAGVVLKEIKNVEHANHGYRASRFRPIVTRKTDISALEALLNPSLEDLRAIVRENANV